MATRRKKAASGKAKAKTKTEMAGELAEATGMTKAQVMELLAAQHELICRELKAGRPVTLPGTAKFTLTRKAATPARPGRNPFTGEAITIKAKGARNVVRVRALKGLKDAV